MKEGSDKLFMSFRVCPAAGQIRTTRNERVHFTPVFRTIPQARTVCMFSCGQVERIPAWPVDCSSQRGVGRLTRSSSEYLASPHQGIRCCLNYCSIREELEYIAGEGTRGGDSIHELWGSHLSSWINIFWCDFLGEEQPHRLRML